MSYLKRLRRFGEVRLLIELKKFDLALLEIEKLMIDFPDDYELWFLRSSVYLELGDSLLAKSAIEESISLNPESSFSFNLKGSIYLFDSKYNKAKECFEQAISLDPNEAVYYSNLGNVLIQKRKYNQAIELSKKALSLSPNHEHSLNNLFWAYSLKGQHSRANSILKENLAHNPENQDTMNNLGYQLYNKGDHRRAEEVFRTILAEHPENKDAIRGFGLATSANNLLMDLFNKKWFERLLVGGFMALNFVIFNIVRFADVSYSILLILPTILALVFGLRAFGLAGGKLVAFLKLKQFRSQFSVEEILVSIMATLLYMSGLVGLIFMFVEAYGTKGITIMSFLTSFYLALFTVNVAIRLNWHSDIMYLKWVLLLVCVIPIVFSLVLTSYWWIAFVGSLAIMTFDVFVAKGVVLKSLE